MKIVWNNRALNNIDNIADYVSNRTSKRAAARLVKQIRDKANGITNFPEKYQREPDFDKSRNIRRAVIHSYKIVYEIKPENV